MTRNKPIIFKIRQKDGTFKLNRQGNDAEARPLGKVNGRAIR